jgi:heptosyltransferase-2
LRPGEDVDNFVKEWIANNIPANHRIVAVAPGSVQPHKRWPEIKFKELVSLIISSYSSLDLVLIGTDKDFHLCESIKNLCPSRIHNLAGVFSIPKSASLLSKVQLLVGNDGGAMHLGDSMKCKVVSIVPGIQYPDSIEPWHNKALAVRHPVECSPCYNFTFCPQGHNRCMTDLPVEKVFNKCITILEEG